MMRQRNPGPRKRPIYRALLPILLLGGFAGTPAAKAQVPPLSARSHSGQFVLVGASTTRSLTGLSWNATNSTSVELSPMLLPISCERIKQCVLREIGSTAPWQGKILLSLRPSRRNDPGVLVASERYRNAWQYRVEIPTPVDRSVYVRAIVQTVLTEIVNRSAGPAGAEVPTWLIEGLTRHVMLSREIEVILAPPGSTARGVSFSPSIVSRVQQDPLKASSDILRVGQDISFEGLSWPAIGMATTEHYAASAHVFVANLLRLSDGKACMRAWLDNLARYENWQTSFFLAYAKHFQTPLQVEKWWALQTSYLKGRTLANTWTRAESEEKLRELLRVPVHVHNDTNSLPASQTVSLQTVLREWDEPQQTTVLWRKLRELEMLRLRVEPDLIPMVEQYREVLTDALNRISRAGLPFGIGRASAREAASARAAMQLDRLDALIGRPAPVSGETLAAVAEAG